MGERRKISKLSFDLESDPPMNTKKLKRHPSAQVVARPSHRDDQLRKELEQQWIEQQIALQNEIVTLEYLYWDGAGHRNHVEIKKGDSIASFLIKVRKKHERIQHVASDNLYFVKDDLILFNHYTFYDFLVSKVKGKQGLLFDEDMHPSDWIPDTQTPESRLGKVVDREWYLANKHIFPASKWEFFDSQKMMGAGEKDQTRKRQNASPPTFVKPVVEKS